MATNSRVLWDAEAGRYRDAATGRFVTHTAIRRALEQSLANLTRRTDGLAADLRAGRISLVEWRNEMRDIVKHTQMAAAELARGGRAQMTQSDYGRVGQAVRRQYGFLEAWVEQIKAGLPFDGRMESRARQYLRAARTTYIANETRALSARGYDEVRSVLHPAEHCAECIAEAARGFVAVSQLVPLGSRTCRSNDRCSLEFRNSSTGRVLVA